MVQATGKLRTFDVELREKGQDPRLVATAVSMDVARSMCREMVGPCIHAVVRPCRAGGSESADSKQRYSIWLWNDSRLKWERIRGRQGITLEQAVEWLRARQSELRDRMTLVAPAHLSHPAEMLQDSDKITKS